MKIRWCKLWLSCTVTWGLNEDLNKGWVLQKLRQVVWLRLRSELKMTRFKAIKTSLYAFPFIFFVPFPYFCVFSINETFLNSIDLFLYCCMYNPKQAGEYSLNNRTDWIALLFFLFYLLIIYSQEICEMLITLENEVPQQQYYRRS